MATCRGLRFLHLCKRVGTRIPYQYCSSKAGVQLSQCLREELRVEGEELKPLPSVGAFSTTITGSLATLQRRHGDQRIRVQMDATNAIEVTPEEEEDEEEGPLFVPTFTVTVTNTTGNSIQFECSFDEYCCYDSDRGNEWDSLRIDSVSVVPKDSSTVESVYSADTHNLSEALYTALLGYLKERGVDENFAADILKFYRMFEHHGYVNSFLEPFMAFVQEQ